MLNFIAFSPQPVFLPGPVYVFYIPSIRGPGIMKHSKKSKRINTSRGTFRSLVDLPRRGPWAVFPTDASSLEEVEWEQAGCFLT